MRDRPGALERVIGLIRRRRVPVQRISITAVGGGVLELVLRLDGEAARERLRVELEMLRDIVAVDDLDADSKRFTRELLLAWIRPDLALRAPAAGRVVALAADGCLLEMTGTPEEIEAVAARLRESGVVSWVRSEVPAPDPDNTEAEDGEA